MAIISKTALGLIDGTTLALDIIPATYYSNNTTEDINNIVSVGGRNFYDEPRLIEHTLTLRNGYYIKYVLNSYTQQPYRHISKIDVFTPEGDNIAGLVNAFIASEHIGFAFAIDPDNETGYFAIVSKNYFNVDFSLISYVSSPNVAFWHMLQDTDPIRDPYAEHGESTTGGGGGSWSRTSEPVGIPSLPHLSVANTGFISLFAPTFPQLRELANYMWGDLWSVDTFKKIFADPMDAILGLNIVPVDVPSAGTSAVVVGNISTGVTMNKASSQFVAVDCGTLNVAEFYGSYLDYSPYTKVQLMLPYIGAVNLDIDDIMHKNVNVVYHVDILTGSCIAFIKCDNSVLYQFNGNCAINIPITSENFTRAIQSVVSLAGNIAGGLASPASGGMNASRGINMAVSSVNNIMGMKPEIRKSGNLGASVGMMGIQKPYFIFTYPRLCSPSKQNEFIGYPSYITMSLGSCSGYTKVNEIHLDGVTATESELIELENLLKSGVIL